MLGLLALASLVVPMVAAPPAAATPSNFLYVANSTDGTVSVINTTNDTVGATPITVGTNPTWVAVVPNGTKAYVTNNGSNNVSVINTANNTVSATVAVGNGPKGWPSPPMARKPM